MYDVSAINCNTSSDCPYQKICKFPILKNQFTTSFQRISYLREWVRKLKTVFADVLIVNFHYPLFREFLKLLRNEHVYYKGIIHLESYQVTSINIYIVFYSFFYSSLFFSFLTLSIFLSFPSSLFYLFSLLSLLSFLFNLIAISGFDNELLYILLPFNPSKYNTEDSNYRNIGYYYSNQSEIIKYFKDSSRMFHTYIPDFSIYGTLTGIIINEIIRELPFSIFNYNYTYEEFCEIHDVINEISFYNDFGKIQFNEESHELNSIELSLLQVKNGKLINDSFVYPATYDWIPPV